MDKIKANDLEAKLKGKSISGFIIETLLGCGKSAAVFKAIKGSEIFAIKVFDNELVERFGYEIQKRRIELEIGLKDHNIQNLVKIYDGGEQQVDDETYFYIVMEYVEGETLSDCIESNRFCNNPAFTKKALTILTNVSEELLARGIVHRDIKPENILILKNEDIVLMDLSVLKHVGAKSFSDGNEKQFISTLRYAPPELITRIEKNETDGWRAINYYQIGAVLHDMVMGEPLFINITPYTNLVIAIKEITPKIDSKKYSFEFIQLIRDLLSKDWGKRLELCPLSRIQHVKVEMVGTDLVSAEFDKIKSMTSSNKSVLDEIAKLKSTKEEIEATRKKRMSDTVLMLEQLVEEFKTNNLIKDVGGDHNFFYVSGDAELASKKSLEIRNFVLTIDADLSHGCVPDLYLYVRIIIDNDGYAEIRFSFFYLHWLSTINVQNNTQLNAPSLLKELYKQLPDSMQNNNTPLSYLAFKGLIDFTEGTKQHLLQQLLSLFRTALDGIKPYVDYELNQLHQNQTRKSGVTAQMVKGHAAKIFYIPH
jgi:serine/threonine protein kinase